MVARKMLVSWAANLASQALSRLASGVDLEDLLGRVGLTRRRHHLPQSLLTFGAGALVGAGVVVLLSEANRERLKASLGELSRYPSRRGTSVCTSHETDVSDRCVP
jgi:hypothetical protein